VQLGVNHAVGPTKGRKARWVPVRKFVLDELSKLCTDKAADGLVFPGSDGSYLPRPKSSRGWFAGAVNRAGVQAITPHDLRHTCASQSVSVGVNVLALQRMLGHTSAKVTLDTYADLFDADLDAVAVTLHATYSRASVGKGRCFLAVAEGLEPSPCRRSRPCAGCELRNDMRCYSLRLPRFVPRGAQNVPSHAQDSPAPYR
jgi:Phage integrase family